MTDLKHDLRAIVALNNMGVSLLEQGRSVPALRTFQDAMRLMKPAFGTVSDDSPLVDVTQKISLDVEEVMKQANKRYAWSEHVHQTTGSIRMAALSCRADPMDMRALAECRPPPHGYLFHPIRFDLDNDDIVIGDQKKEGALLYCFVVVHNYCVSIACCLPSHRTADHPMQIRLFRMFSLCQRVLSSLRSDNPAYRLHRRHMYLEYLIRVTHYSALSSSGRVEEAGHVESILDRMREILVKRSPNGDLEFLVGSKITKAPAA